MLNVQSQRSAQPIFIWHRLVSSVLKWEGWCSEVVSSLAQPDSGQLTALLKGKENLHRLPSPAKERISQHESWKLHGNLLLQWCQGMHEEGKEQEIVQKWETPLLLGKQQTTNTNHVACDLRLFGKVIKKGCCVLLINHVTCPIRTSFLL